MNRKLLNRRLFIAAPMSAFGDDLDAYMQMCEQIKLAEAPLVGNDVDSVAFAGKYTEPGRWGAPHQSLGGFRHALEELDAANIFLLLYPRSVRSLAMAEYGAITQRARKGEQVAIAVLADQEMHPATFGISTVDGQTLYAGTVPVTFAHLDPNDLMAVDITRTVRTAIKETLSV